MGAKDALVAVSNWDAERPEIAGLARVGDYRTVDWEKLASLRPDVMIVQWRPDKMPPGVVERAAELHIELVNLRIVYLDEIFTALQTLGDGIGQREKADSIANDLHRQLDRVRAAVAGKPPVRTLIAQTESPLSTVGGGNFMNDLLAIAGGTNVIKGGDNSYPNIDLERLVALNPDVVIHLLPGESPQVIERAKAFWSSHPELTAVKNGRVYFESESFMLLPGPLVGKIAERFATLLHPGVTFDPGTAAATSRSVSQKAPPASRYAGERAGERGERRETTRPAGLETGRGRQIDRYATSSAPRPSPLPSPPRTGKREGEPRIFAGQSLTSQKGDAR
ncbi:MAG: helical backbone metal receptor [Planctomycetota bacterium]|nr:helical backbone metal receptor [Planctomycetota bacterium]